jgi:general secretion pathway protein G
MQLSTKIKPTAIRPRGIGAVRKGFTLIELMVVILILAILAALIIPRIVGRAAEAKIAAAKSDEATLASSLEQFKLNCDRYPTTEEGLQALNNMPSGMDGKWKGPYLSKDIPNDPWGYPYQYQCPGVNGPDSFTITSNGPTGQPGGTGDNAPIVDTES